jgi:ribonuclease PH
MADEKKKETVRLSTHRVVMHLNKGGLHRALGVPEGTDIPEDKLSHAMNSKNEHLKRMAELAKTMKSWKH